MKHDLKTALEQETYTGMKGELVLLKEELQQLKQKPVKEWIPKGTYTTADLKLTHWLINKILGENQQ
ncbi:hypothetical protein E3J49_02615 [Candidatus Bathyarchaeota archaeon]|nr:MAG: hypothetical protein E3J49_02615 [Candidatus Bathyarchaeota archaeon]